MKFKAELINILDDEDCIIGFIDAKTPDLLFVPKEAEYSIDELQTIINKMKDMKNGSST